MAFLLGSKKKKSHLITLLIGCLPCLMRVYEGQRALTLSYLVCINCWLNVNLFMLSVE